MSPLSVISQNETSFFTYWLTDLRERASVSGSSVVVGNRLLAFTMSCQQSQFCDTVVAYGGTVVFSRKPKAKEKKASGRTSSALAVF